MVRFRARIRARTWKSTGVKVTRTREPLVVVCRGLLPQDAPAQAAELLHLGAGPKGRHRDVGERSEELVEGHGPAPVQHERGVGHQCLRAAHGRDRPSSRCGQPCFAARTRHVSGGTSSAVCMTGVQRSDGCCLPGSLLDQISIVRSTSKLRYQPSCVRVMISSSTKILAATPIVTLPLPYL